MTKDARDTMRAEEVVALLGVKRATLYSYVSRGLIRTLPDPEEARRQRYLRADVEKLLVRQRARAGHAAAASDALSWGQPVLDSAITEIRDGALRYRGFALEELLAKRRSYERVAEILWGTEPAEEPQWRPNLETGTLPRMTRGAPLQRLAIALPQLAVQDPSPFATSSQDVIQKARRLIPHLAGLSFQGGSPGTERSGAERPGTNVGVTARSIAAALRLNDKSAGPLIESALVCSADHGLNASTFAVRVVASTGADLYACLSAGLAGLSGPRHGGATLRFGHLLAESAQGDRSVREYLGSRIARGDAVPGFGHPLYTDGDPRGVHLIRMAQRAGSDRMDPLDELLDAARFHGLPEPTLDAGLVAVALALGQEPAVAQVFFAIGRMAGWVAHMLEQQSSSRLLRPRARYTGPGKRTV